MEDAALYSGYEREASNVPGEQRGLRASQPADDAGPRQGSLFDTETLPPEPAGAQLADNFLLRYKQVPVGEFRLGRSAMVVKGRVPRRTGETDEQYQAR